MPELNNSFKKKNIGKINLGQIQYHIKKKSINITEKLDLNLFKKLNIVNKKCLKLKILGTGEIKDKVLI